MADFVFDPALPARPSAEASFLQEIRLAEAGKTIARAVWHAPSGSDGAVQLIELWVDPGRRRKGVGSELMQAVCRQAVMFQRSRKTPLRRVWAVVQQKSQVIARAFLTRHGFHHVSTIENLLKEQDALIYTKALD